jgi:hypothetical protein
MEEVIYSNNHCTITVVPEDPYEMKVNINGQNIIWISKPEKQL